MNVERLRDDGPFRQDLERDLSLHNDVLFSLPTVCQLVIDIACGAWSRPSTRLTPVERFAEVVRSIES